MQKCKINRTLITNGKSHGHRKYSGEAVSGIKTVSCSVQVLGGSSGMLPHKNIGILGTLRSNLMQFLGLNISCSKQ